MGSFEIIHEPDGDSGIYLLVIRLYGPRWIQIGGLGYRFFHRGSYGYVGSARRGMKSRLNRHLKEVKRLHWHIDHLLHYAEIEAIIYGQCYSDKECMLANELSRIIQFLPGFGSTDCGCTSHLFFPLIRDPLLGLDMAPLGESVLSRGSIGRSRP